MNDLVLEKTKELGKIIAESAEHQEFVKWSDAMENDVEAKELVTQYNEKRDAKMRELRELGKEPDAETMRAAHEYVQNEFSKILDNETIFHYIEANKAFDAMMQQVNQVLKFCVTGEEEPEGGCSGSCHTCGGGCHH